VDAAAAAFQLVLGAKWKRRCDGLLGRHDAILRTVPDGRKT
jgi:hypothetical protein